MNDNNYGRSDKEKEEEEEAKEMAMRDRHVAC